jgi:hypothetical protein
VLSEYCRISERLRLYWCGVPGFFTAFFGGDQCPCGLNLADPGL